LQVKPAQKFEHIEKYSMASKFREVEVLTVHHWNDTLFSFTTTRDPGFRFQNGQFIMIGLMVETSH